MGRWWDSCVDGKWDGVTGVARAPKFFFTDSGFAYRVTGKKGARET